MRLAKSVSITFISKIIIIFLGLISSVVIARTLGPSGKGVFAVISVIIGVAVQFGNVGLHSSNIYYVSRDSEKLPQIAGNSLWLSIVGGLSVALLTFGICRLFPNLFLGRIPAVFLTISLVSIPFSFMALFFQNILLSLQKIYEYNFVEIAGKFIYVLLAIVFLVFLNRGVFSLVVIFTVVPIIIGLAYLYLLHSLSPISYGFNKELFYEMFKYGFKSYMSCFFAFLIIRSDMILVNYYLGIGEAGIYSIAVNFADLIYLLPTVIGLMLFPKVSASQDESGYLTKKVSRFMTFLMLFICIFACLISKFLIVNMYGPKFESSVLPFLYLIPGIYFLSLETIYMNDFAGRGNPAIVYIAPAFGFVLNLVLNILLIPKLGVKAAAINSTIAYFLIFILTLEYLRRMTKSNYSELLVLNLVEIKEILAGFKQQTKR